MSHDTPIENNVNTIFSLLEEERPLVVKPKLATLIGLNEAIILQQIKYWITNPLNKNIKQGRVWVYKTYLEWHEEFPFFSLPTIKRTILNLEEMGLILSSNFNISNIDRTKWYTINLPQNIDMVGMPLDQIDSSIGSKRSIHGINLIHSNHRLQTYTTNIDQEKTNARARESAFDETKKLEKGAADKITHEEAKNLFTAFFENYPLKKGKVVAEKAWVRRFGALNRTSASELFEKIGNGLINHRTEHDLVGKLREDFPREKIFYPSWPHCSTWINQNRWEDSYVTDYEGVKNEYCGKNGNSKHYTVEEPNIDIEAIRSSIRE